MKNKAAPERPRAKTRSAGTMRTASGQKDTGYKPKKQRRKGISLKVYATIMVLLTIGVAVTLCLTVFFNIDTIEVEGGTRYTSDEVVAASGLRKSDNLLLADLGGAKEKILAALPFLEQVEIRRRLPTGVQIVLTEAEPVLSVDSQEGSLVLSTTGKVLAVQEQAQPNTIRITGVSFEKQAQPGEAYTRESDELSAVWRVYDAFDEAGMLPMLRSMDLSDPLAITLAYGEDITIDIGTSAQLPDKLEVLRAVLETKAEPGKKMLLHITATQATIKYTA